MLLSAASYSQVEYTVTAIGHGTINSSGKMNIISWQPVAKKFTVILYNDALVFDDQNNSYYKFTRKIIMPNNHVLRWNALDKSGNECKVLIEDYGSYSFITIAFNDNRFIDYRTL